MFQFRKFVRSRPISQGQNTKGVQPWRQHSGKPELVVWSKKKQKAN